MKNNYNKQVFSKYCSKIKNPQHIMIINFIKFDYICTKRAYYEKLQPV